MAILVDAFHVNICYIAIKILKYIQCTRWKPLTKESKSQKVLGRAPHSWRNANLSFANSGHEYV